MNEYAYALFGLSLLLVILAGLLLFVALRLRVARRRARATPRGEAHRESAFMAAAMQEAVGKLRAQEQVMQARAEASERLASEIIASMTSGLLVVDRDGQVRTLNPAARTLLGVPDAAATGSFRTLLADVPALVQVVDECLQTAQPIIRRSVELAASSTRPTVTHLGVTVSPIVDANGVSSGAIGLFTDLTTIVRLEEQLRLKDSLARLGELTAGIAHEFRNGLATIHGYARLLDPAAVPEPLHPYVDGIRAETVALRDVVNNFLNFAKPTELTLAPVDVRAVADRAAEDVRADVRDHGGSIRVLGDFARIEGDEVLLRQAFSNLFRNALEACAGAGVVPSIVLQGAIERGERVQIVTVSDNGPGFHPESIDRVFEPFFTTKRDGTGLGLALVQKIVVNHDGRIAVSNDPRSGGRVRVELPTADRDLRSGGPRAAGAHGRATGSG